MMCLSRLLATTSAMAALICAPAWADIVSLESFDGSISIRGELLEFDNESYTIRSPVGIMTVDALEMRCSGEGCPVAPEEVPVVRVAGSLSVGKDLIPSLVDSYARTIDAGIGRVEGNASQSIMELSDDAETNVVRFDIALTNSTEGLSTLASQDADIAVSTRPALPAEIVEIAGNGTAGDKEQVIALDGIVVVTHPANPVRAVAEADLPKIFSGQVSRWSQIGGYDADIKLYIRSPESGTADIFVERVMEPARARFGGNVTVLESDQAVSQAVARDPFGIGISSYSALGRAKALSIRGTCGMQTPVNTFTIKTEEYPLTRRIYAYTGERDLEGHGRRLLDYALSDEGQLIVSRVGLVDQIITARPIDSQGIRLASAMMDNGTEVRFSELREMMGDLIVGDRMSLTFRFDFGSSRLDSRAVGDIERLAELLATGSYENKEILLVGFTDAIGEPGKNRALSQARAAVVRDALINAAPRGSLDNVRIRTAGFGEVSPLSCNDTEAGRQINRRVEVWVSDLVSRAN